MKKTNMKRLPCILAIAVIFVFRIVNYSALELPAMYSDSGAYVSFDWEFFAEHFVVKTGRAPLYPVLISACRVFGDHYLDVLIGIQMLLSATALFALYEILKMLGVNYYLRLVLVVFYGASPAVCGWDGCVLTESLSLTFMVWFFFFVVRYIKVGNGKNAAAAAIISFMMSFLRPQFLYVFAALFVFFVLKSLFEETQRKTNRKMLVMMVVQTGLILIYCWNFKAVFGVFSLTDALPRQEIKICVDRGYYKELENQDITKTIEQCLQDGQDNWQATKAAVYQFGNAEIDRQAKKYFREHLNAYLGDTVHIVLEDMTTRFYGYDRSASPMKENAPRIAYRVMQVQNTLFQPVTVGWALVASLLSGVAMVFVWIRKKKMPWIHMALFSISMCTTYLTYFVTCDEYMRTMITVLPLLCIMVGMFLQWGCTEPLQEREQTE